MEIRRLFCLLLFIASYSLVHGNVWTQKRKAYKSKALTTTRMKRVAGLTSMKEFKSYLKPLLRVRVSGTPENKEVRQYLEKTMADLGWTVETDVFRDQTPYGEKEFANVIATHSPSASRRLTLACHFDSKQFDKFTFVAATDSAVPCAMLLELVRVLGPSLDKSKSKDVSLQLLFFDGEEAFVNWNERDSLYGARHLADKMHINHNYVDRETKVSDLERMDALVLLDLIGNKGCKFRNWFASTSRLFERLQKIEQRLVQAKLLVQAAGSYFPGGNLRGGGIEDDHIPFLRKEVPVLHLIAYPFPDTWHRSTDDEAHLDYDTINDLNKIMAIFVAEYLHLSP